jgi:hypothetical protein
MTAQELIDRLNRYRKAVALRGLAEIVIMMLPPLLLWIGLALRLLPLPGSLWMNLLWIGLFLLISWIVVGVGLFSFTSYAIRIATGLGLYCPHCRRPLVGPRLTKRVIASAKCAHCGVQVLDDGP